MAAPKEGGFKMSFGSLKAKPGLKATTKAPAKRSRLLDDDEPDEPNKKQEISGWDAAEGGAVDVNSKKEEKKGPLVIPALPNRDWRGEARRKQLARAAQQQQQQQQNGDSMEQDGKSKIQYGLTIMKKEGEKLDDATEEATEGVEKMEVDDGLTDEQRLEKNALDALLHGKAKDESVIPAQSEEEAFQNDFREAPDAPTLEAYEAIPIDGFGAALLRGMGWKDGEEIGRHGTSSKPKEIKRRPALLGIGAKEEAAVGVELGEWGKGKKKAQQSYNPVTLRNKHTGEMITEDELKTRLEAQTLLKDEKPSRNGRKYDDDSEDERRRERRRKEKREDRDRRRDDDYDSERRRDRDRRDDRRRDRGDDSYDRDRDSKREKRRGRDDDYYDSDRKREKRRDRDRRDRSRSPDDRKERRRERDRRERSRSRDSDDRRKRRRDRGYAYDDEREDRKRRH